jgi:hypothetical protein
MLKESRQLDIFPSISKRRFDNEYDNVKVNIGDRNVLRGAKSTQKRKEFLRNERKNT